MLIYPDPYFSVSEDNPFKTSKPIYLCNTLIAVDLRNILTSKNVTDVKIENKYGQTLPIK